VAGDGYGRGNAICDPIGDCDPPRGSVEHLHPQILGGVSGEPTVGAEQLELRTRRNAVVPIPPPSAWCGGACAFSTSCWCARRALCDESNRRRSRGATSAIAQIGASPVRARHDCFCPRAGAGRAIAMATFGSSRSAGARAAPRLCIRPGGESLRRPPIWPFLAAGLERGQHNDPAEATLLDRRDSDRPALTGSTSAPGAAFSTAAQVRLQLASTTGHEPLAHLSPSRCFRAWSGPGRWAVRPVSAG
jgi:hypothetical protein